MLSLGHAITSENRAEAQPRLMAARKLREEPVCLRQHSAILGTDEFQGSARKCPRLG